MERAWNQRKKPKKATGTVAQMFMTVFLAFACAGCGTGQPASNGFAATGGAVGKGEKSDFNLKETEVSGQAGLDAGDSISEGTLLRSILLGDAQFLYKSDGSMERMAVTDVPSLFGEDDSYMKIWQFAVADLDGDGEQEAVLFVCGVAGDMGGRLILHQAGDEMYGYRTDNRTLVNLKTDGTYEYSDPTGVAEVGVAAITSFSENGFTADRITYATGTKEGWNAFVVDHETATEDEYEEAVSRQKEKEDVLWYEFTEEDINTFVSNEEKRINLKFQNGAVALSNWCAAPFLKK